MRCAVCGWSKQHVLHDLSGPPENPKRHEFDPPIPESRVRALRDEFSETVGRMDSVPKHVVYDIFDALLREGGAK